VSSLFDSNVRSRRNHTPWAKMSLMMFAKEMALNCGCCCKDRMTGDHGFRLNVEYRASVASGFWFTVEWCGSGGQRLSVSSQELDLALWRAAEAETEAQRKAGRDREGAGGNGAPGNGQHPGPEAP